MHNLDASFPNKLHAVLSLSSDDSDEFCRNFKPRLRHLRTIHIPSDRQHSNNLLSQEQEVGAFSYIFKFLKLKLLHCPSASWVGWVGG